MKIPSPDLPERLGTPGCSAGGMISDIVARIERLNSSIPTAHIRLLDQIISNKISPFDLVDRAEELDSLCKYLNSRVSRVNDLTRRLSWIRSIPSRKSPMGF